MRVLTNDLNRFVVDSNAFKDPGFKRDGKEITGINGFHGTLENIIGWILEKFLGKTVQIKSETNNIYYINCKSFANWYTRVNSGVDKEKVEKDSHDRVWVQSVLDGCKKAQVQPTVTASVAPAPASVDDSNAGEPVVTTPPMSKPTPNIPPQPEVIRTLPYIMGSGGVLQPYDDPGVTAMFNATLSGTYFIDGPRVLRNFVASKVRVQFYKNSYYIAEKPVKDAYNEGCKFVKYRRNYEDQKELVISYEFAKEYSAGDKEKKTECIRTLLAEMEEAIKAS